MNKPQSYRLKRKKSFIWRRMVFVIFLCMFPSNYCGKKIQLRSKNDSAYHFHGSKQSHEKIIDDLKIMTPKLNKNFRPVGIETNVVVSSNFMMVTVTCFLLTNILLLLLHGYLNSVSFEKHGMLLYLYMDIVRCCLLINGIWLVGVVACKVFGNGLNLNEKAAKPISYCFLALGQILMLTLNVMAILRFQMLKEGMLDPPMPWDTSDEDTVCSMNKIRCFILLLTSLFICVLYGLDICPKNYYSFIGDERSLFELPIGTTILTGFQLFLLLTYTITAVLNEFRKKASQQDCCEELYPRQLNYLLPGYIILSIVFLASPICIPYGHGYLWITLQSIITIGGVIFPGSLILLVSPLRSYTGRKISNGYLVVLETIKNSNWFRYVYYAFRRRSPVVVPMI